MSVACLKSTVSKILLDDKLVHLISNSCTPKRSTLFCEMILLFHVIGLFGNPISMNGLSF